MGFPLRFVAAVLAAVVWAPLTTAEDAIEARGFSGNPFGIGMVRVPVRGNRPESQPSDVTWMVEGTDGRVFYPCYFRESIPGSTDPNALSARGAYFLFKGDTPLKVKFSDGRKTTDHELTVVHDAKGKDALLARWWSQYQRSASGMANMPIVENYTTHMLARRLGLTPPAPRSGTSWPQDEMLGSFLGFEEMRLAMQADRMLDNGDAPEPADQPLPAAALPPAIEVPEFVAGEVEPLASRVPEACFYLRFGSYGNYRWFRDTMNEWGGNLREIVAVRSVDYDIAGRLERQLVLKDSELGKLLGGAAISDMAVIGTDTFVREGASIGVLFQEKQPGILAAAIKAQRLAVKQQAGVTEQALDMEGVPVSVLTSPGNVIRSYYVADGGFHFVTNSSTLARRFVATGKGVGRLSDLREFQYARTKHSTGKENPILAYLSDPFIRQLVSPAYRVEMTRRMKAEADVELVALARLAAMGEAAAHGSVDELVAGGFLPAKFGKRADETIPLLVDGKTVDSLRGARRTFLPVADVHVEAFTKSEVEAYQRFSQSYQALYRRMDPISMSLTRQATREGRERIVLDVSITPFTRQNLGALAGFLPPASRQEITAGPEVLALLQVGSKSQVFAGVFDCEIEHRFENGRGVADRATEERPPLFLGEYGNAYRDLLDLKGEKSADGYFSSPDALNPEPARRFGLDYGREWKEWWAASFREQALKELTPGLSISEGERPAQLRLKIGDLGQSKLATLLRAGLYQLEREASRANARSLNSYTTQFKVEEAGALSAAAEVLGANLVCPLGGEYRRDPPDYQFSTHQPWYSTAWPAPKEPWKETPFFERLSLSHLHEVPASYDPKLLKWVKGLAVEVRFEDQTMFSRVELEVQPAIP
ncbi:hypothetical protein Pan44_40170 [Caulifigura coniformis]|uniref:Uncharacterized protein n=1 Tax=Caulifigura coniformis TaxID=2527983 RepID=A0A517SIL1_9PLAN|nr:hypothetical protein [Caulifigura coniformis]QDT55968.1 hypothetical protein Pan44_40170 [Caulifigura coniformis]